MIERIDVDIQTGDELHTASLEQGVFSIDGKPYRQLDDASSAILSTCMLQPGTVVDWRDIIDYTGVSKRQIGYGLATEMRLDHTVEFRNPGQSGQSFVSAIYPEIPKKNIGGDISVRGLQGLRFNNKISSNSTIYDIVNPDTEEPEVYVDTEPEYGEASQIPSTSYVSSALTSESDSLPSSELILFMRPKEVYSLDRIIEALRVHRNYSNEVSNDQVRAELAVLVRIHNKESDSRYEVKMNVVDGEPIFTLVHKNFTPVSTDGVSMGSQLNSLS